MDAEVFKLFNEIKQDYSTMQDTDMVTAFSVMKRASALLFTIESEVAHLYKQLSFMEQKANATKAQVSSQHSAKVTVGDRYAESEPTVMAAVADVNKVREAIRLSEAAMKFLQRVYFDCKNVANTSRKELKYNAEEIKSRDFTNKDDWRTSF